MSLLFLSLPLATAAPLSPSFQTLQAARVIDPRDGSLTSPLSSRGRKALVVLLPQLGEFDSAEMCEQLVAVRPDLQEASIDLCVVGIGDAAGAGRFSEFTGLPLDVLRVDPDAAIHEALGLHAGPEWSVPDAVPDSVLTALLGTLPGGVPADDAQLRPAFTAWLRYLAMCAGIGAPGTLPEILRGYLGDRSAPERFAPDAVVTAGPVVIGPGVGPVKLGPISYANGWAEEEGYQRPVELATVRLRNMVEVLGRWSTYVANPTKLAQRGGTFLFDADGAALYEYRHRGVLTYSSTMSRPLTFLAPHIGHKALNPLQLGDAAVARQASQSSAEALVSPVP
mmetsp:Transcript_17291/g.55650  ORF Transcript_17291/g.55650 Transcript_17291/m.55650 type:complete len:338 (+) Transcript_17291:221-1234(+)